MFPNPPILKIGCLPDSKILKSGLKFISERNLILSSKSLITVSSSKSFSSTGLIFLNIVLCNVLIRYVSIDFSLLFETTFINLGVNNSFSVKVNPALVTVLETPSTNTLAAFPFCTPIVNVILLLLSSNTGNAGGLYLQLPSSLVANLL